MKKIKVLNNVTGRRYEKTFETVEEANAWKQRHIDKNTWGKPERWLKQEQFDYETIAMSIDSREIELEPAYDKHTYQTEEVEETDAFGNTEIVQRPVLDENGNPIILSTETIPAVMGIEYKIPCDYVITEEESNNGYFNIEDAYSELRILRDKYLAETDFTQLPDAPVDATLRSRYVEYRSYLRTLPSNYTDQNITSFRVMTFSQWRSQMYPAD